MDRPSHDCIVVFIIYMCECMCVFTMHFAFCVWVRMCGWELVHACVHASMRACVRACMRTYEWLHVFLITCALLYRLVLIT